MDEETEDDADMEAEVTGDAAESKDAVSEEDSSSESSSSSEDESDGDAADSRASASVAMTNGSSRQPFQSGGGRRPRAHSPLLDAELDPELYGLRRTGRARIAPKRFEVSLTAY
jgi:hypothetical protein